jgi:glycosyltransferase involved in cell wall biosynthesis
MPRLSVIIPTHRRPATLMLCLEHLAKQTIAEELEVIVVSDGHDPATAKLFGEGPSSKGQGPRKEFSSFTFLEVPKSQQGIARNRGVEKASSPYVLFIGDDMLLAPDACEKHLVAHAAAQAKGKTNRLAVLGFTTWDPAVGITPAMTWLEKTGWQFGYPLLKPYEHAVIPEDLQHRVTYTINISLPTMLAREHLFPEEATLYGWEDIEWGTRLKKDGVKLWYEPRARGLHHHHVSMEDSLRRMETLGRSAVLMSRLNPDLDRLPKGWKLLAYRIIAALPTMRGRHAKALLRGIEAA